MSWDVYIPKIGFMNVSCVFTTLTPCGLVYFGLWNLSGLEKGWNFMIHVVNLRSVRTTCSCRYRMWSDLNQLLGFTMLVGSPNQIVHKYS